MLPGRDRGSEDRDDPEPEHRGRHQPPEPPRPEDAQVDAARRVAPQQHRHDQEPRQREELRQPEEATVGEGDLGVVQEHEAESRAAIAVEGFDVPSERSRTACCCRVPHEALVRDRAGQSPTRRHPHAGRPGYRAGSRRSTRREPVVDWGAKPSATARFHTSNGACPPSAGSSNTSWNTSTPPGTTLPAQLS